MDYNYDRREAARKPVRLTEDEKKALTTTLGHNLRQLDFNTFDIGDIKPNVVKSLHKKGLIFAQYRIRFTPKVTTWRKASPSNRQLP